jgi:hypothetical protein
MTGHRSTTAQVVKKWLDIGLIAGVVGFAALVVWLLVSPFQMSGPEGWSDVAVPVAIGNRSFWPQLSVGVSDAGAVAGSTLESAPPRFGKVVKGRGELRFETRSWSLAAFTLVEQLPWLVILLYVLNLLRGILKTVLDGQPFAPANAGRLRIIGLVCIGAGVVVPILEYLTARVVLSSVVIEGVDLRPPLHFTLDPILAGLMVLVLAGVFEHGAHLEQDRTSAV